MAYLNTEEIIVINFSERIKCYAQLFKLRLTSFVVISAVFGYFIGTSTINFSEVLFLILGGLFITCSSNAFNQIIERNYDKLMERTKNRPLPLNKLSITEAIITSSSVGLIGLIMLWILNPLTDRKSVV